MEDISKIIRAELERLVEAGADFLQVDEPAFHPLLCRAFASKRGTQ